MPLHLLENIADLHRYPLADRAFREEAAARLAADGCLELPGFVMPGALQDLCEEGDAKQGLAYYCNERHTVYLAPPSDAFDETHPANRLIESTKGCITDDQIAQGSPLRILYDSNLFRDFLCAVLGEENLYEYADSLSSINIHYASEGQELGWHFDNSSFATTLMIREPSGGGRFEYIRNMRDSGSGDFNYDGVGKVLDGETSGSVLPMRAGTLLLFRGRDAIHRVTPVTGGTTRMLAVLAYNSEPGIALSEAARMTFYGRLE